MKTSWLLPVSIVVIIILALLVWKLAERRPPTLAVPPSSLTSCVVSDWDSVAQTFDLDGFIMGCPEFRDAIIWEEATGGQSLYGSWDSAKKQRLQTLFKGLVDNWSDLGVQCPDPLKNMHAYPATKFPPRIFLDHHEALDVFLAHVAHVLYLEVSGQVPWTITDRPALEREHLLSSRHYHRRILQTAAYDPLHYPSHIQPDQDFQLVPRYAMVPLLCDPRVGYRFLRGDNSVSGVDLVGSSEEETLRNVTAWFGDNVIHGEGHLEYVDVGTMADHWCFLKDRLTAKPRPYGICVISPYGCHSSADLMVDLLRSVNVPLLRIRTGQDPDSYSHSGLVFRFAGSDRLVLWHVDELNAAGVNPSFAVSASGTPLPAVDNDQVFFDAHWVSPAVLTAWGFSYDSTHPVWKPPPGYSAQVDEDREDFGRLGGVWPEDPVYPDFVPWLHYTKVKQHELCSSLIMNDFCNLTEAKFALNYGGLGPTALNVTWVLDVQMLYERAEFCVNAHGGCGSAKQLYDTWEAQRGANNNAWAP